MEFFKMPLSSDPPPFLKPRPHLNIQSTTDPTDIIKPRPAFVPEAFDFIFPLYCVEEEHDARQHPEQEGYGRKTARIQTGSPLGSPVSHPDCSQSIQISSSGLISSVNWQSCSPSHTALWDEGGRCSGDKRTSATLSEADHIKQRPLTGASGEQSSRSPWRRNRVQPSRDLLTSAWHRFLWKMLG